VIKLKELLTEAPQIKKVKNVSVQYMDAEYQGETLHGFKYFKKGPWLYKKDNGEYFAVVITNKNNRYEIQLGKLKNNIQATAAVEKIIKKNLNKFESVVKVSKKDDVPGNVMKMKGEEKIKKLVYSGSNGTGGYEIKGKNLNVIGIRPRDKGFFVRHFTNNTGFRKANLYYDGVQWQGDKKFESVNEKLAMGDEYVGTARLGDGRQVMLYRSNEADKWSIGKKHGIKKWDYYLLVKGKGADYIVDTGTKILSKAGKWAQGYIQRKLSGTGKERFQ